MAAQLQRRSYSALTATVDRQAGVLRGVAVITVGPALGHGMYVDRTTLAQVKQCAETYEGGMKVKLDHSGSAAEIVGYLRNFVQDGDVLRADLHLLKSSPRREYILELAETIPDTFGLSISFSGVDEKINDRTFARCSEIYSADIVSEPAANPSGLFQAQQHADGMTVGKTQTTPTTMSPDDIQKVVEDCLSAALAPINERLSKLEMPAAGEPKKEDDAAMSAKLAKAAELGALSALRSFQAALPAPSQFSAPATQPTVKKFEEIVRDLKASGVKHNEAVQKAMKENASEYDSYRARVTKGEVILF